MDKMKRFIDCYIDTETCNMHCHYCYIAQKNLFNNKLVHFEYSPETIAKALSKSRLGGVCLLNICAGGETLLSDEMIPTIKALLEEGHYVMVVTNGTLTKRFEEFLTFSSDLKKRLFFKFSLHYLELKRLGWIDRFIYNVNLMKAAGFSMTLEITPSDELIPYIDELKSFCIKEFGALCHVTIARDDRTLQIKHLSKYSFSEYKSIWSVFQSELFEFKSKLFYKRRKEFCYAGEYTLTLNLSNGTLRQCYGGKVLCNIYDNIERPIKFQAIGHGCNHAHCYNGHVFLSLGAIPSLNCPAYNVLRDRVTLAGEHWLQPDMLMFMKQKISDNNDTYSPFKKLLFDILNVKRIMKKELKLLYTQLFKSI